MMDTIERLRQKYRPRKVRLLFVGESPPASGRFFYQGGTALATHTQAAFERAFSRQCAGEEAFLRFMQASGCWLEDVCHSPVDHLPGRDRLLVVRGSLPEFAQRLRRYAPGEIVVVLRRIYPGVVWAAEAAGLRVRVHRLPFPGFGWQRVYRDELTLVIRSARRRGVFSSG